MELKIELALIKAVEAPKAGRLQVAEALYRSILQCHPKHPEANHNLDTLAVSVNNTEVALQVFRNALEANPNQVQFWLSYINVLF